MIAIWLLYATIVAVLITTAALLAERGMRAMRWPSRGLWAGAIAASLVVPVIGTALRGKSAEAALVERIAPVLADDATATAQPLTPSPTGAERRAPTLAERLARRGVVLASVLDRPLIALWALGSLAMLSVVLLAAVRLAGARREWPLALVDDQFVRISEDTGPAVVGFAPSEIVLPEWAVAMAPERRALLLAHEREHVRARDPVLLLAGLVAVVLAPWNAALWWQLRRLRLAVEMDCDARVLTGCSDVRGYGALLIEVGRRTARAPLAAAAFSEPATHLERRIHMMLARPPRWRVLRALSLGTAALALAIVACDLKAPVAPNPEAEVAITELGANGKSYNVKEWTSGNRLYEAIVAHFPEMIGATGDTLWTVQFVVDHEDRIVGAYKHGTPRDGTLQPAPMMLLHPARVEVRETPNAPERVAYTELSRADRADVERASALEAPTRNATTLEVDRKRGTAEFVELRAERRPVIRDRQAVEARLSAKMASSVAAGPAVRMLRRQPTLGIAIFESPIASPRSASVGALQRVRSDDVESVEVMKGGALNFTGVVSGVIWIKLKGGIARTSW